MMKFIVVIIETRTTVFRVIDLRLLGKIGSSFEPHTEDHPLTNVLLQKLFQKLFVDKV